MKTRFSGTAVTCKKSAWALLLSLSTLLAPQSGASDEVDGVFGLSPAGTSHYIAVEITHEPDRALRSVQWYHNDELSSFPSLVLMEAAPDAPPDLGNTAMVLRDVAGASLAWAESEFQQAVNSTTGIIFAVFRFPENQLRSADGAGGGPGLGYWQRGEGPNPRAYVSADGLNWARLNPEYSVAVRPVWSSGKRAAVPLASLVVEAADHEEATEVVQAKEANDKVDTTPLLAFPNPFNPRTRIRLYLPAAGAAELALYDIRGRRVSTLLDEHLARGEHFVTWEGTDGNDRAVASGVYFLQAKLPDAVHRLRLVLVR